jgi:hypothetical protein
MSFGLSKRTAVKRNMEEKKDVISGGRTSIILVEGSQALPARPSDKDRTGVKTLQW